MKTATRLQTFVAVWSMGHKPSSVTHLNLATYLTHDPAHACQRETITITIRFLYDAATCRVSLQLERSRFSRPASRSSAAVVAAPSHIMTAFAAASFAAAPPFITPINDDTFSQINRKINIQIVLSV